MKIPQTMGKELKDRRAITFTERLLKVTDDPPSPVLEDLNQVAVVESTYLVHEVECVPVSKLSALEWLRATERGNVAQILDDSGKYMQAAIRFTGESRYETETEKRDVTGVHYHRQMEQVPGWYSHETRPIGSVLLDLTVEDDDGHQQVVRFGPPRDHPSWTPTSIIYRTERPGIYERVMSHAPIEWLPEGAVSVHGWGSGTYGHRWFDPPTKRA